MKNLIRRQEGLTLIELLATIAILSTLVVLLWGVLLNGFNYSNKAQETVSLQQEANLLMTKLARIHQTHHSYTITFGQEPIKVIYPNQPAEIISNPAYRYEFYDIERNTDKPLISDQIIDEDKSLKLIIASKKNPTLIFEVRTTLSRLEGEHSIEAH